MAAVLGLLATGAGRWAAGAVLGAGLLVGGYWYVHGDGYREGYAAAEREHFDRARAARERAIERAKETRDEVRGLSDDERVDRLTDSVR